MGGPAPHPGYAAIHPGELETAREQRRLQSARWLSGLRLVAASAFLALAAGLGYGGGLAEWRSLAWGFAGYVCIAALVAVLARSHSPGWLGQAVPAVDVLVVFWLQHVNVSLSPLPGGVAGFTLGPLVFLVLLTSVTARPGSLVATAALAWTCEGVLQREVGSDWGSVLASGLILGATCAVTLFQARVVEALVSRLVTKEVERRVATEQGAETARARDALQQKHAQLLEAQREAEALTRFLVHDMKGPLTGIKALVELACDSLPKASDERDLLDTAADLAQRLVQMMGDLLTISRLESSGRPLKAATAELAPLLESVRSTLAGQARQGGALVEVRVPARLTARIDAGLLQRMLENLGSNALRYLQAGDRLEFSAVVEAGALVVAVCNSGPPVPAQIRPHLFEKGASSNDSRHNVGLGLYFCRMVAEAHGGLIALEDRDAPWNVAFVTRIPLCDARAEVAAARAHGASDAQAA